MDGKSYNKNYNKNGVILNAYPDSIGENLGEAVRFLKLPELKQVFNGFYILPSCFNSDIDRGFSIIDYNLNETLADESNFDEIKGMGIGLKLDFLINHISVLSHQFQDLLKNGENSEYKDFFINWNKFWEGYGEITDSGYIQPDPDVIKDMFFRKPGLPFLMVRFPDGRDVPYWNTFYQEVRYPRPDAVDLYSELGIQYQTAARLSEIICNSLNAGMKPSEIEYGRFSKRKERITEYLEARRKYLGQMDLNIKSPLVWAYYDETLKKLRDYGAETVRLDAFAYASKEPKTRCFLNEPGAWEVLEKFNNLAKNYSLTLLPEIHASYEEGVYRKLADKGYLIYDFFLPGLIIDAFARQTNEILLRWIKEILDNNIRTVNMLGCHDGIPLLDLKGLLTDRQIEKLVGLVTSRGGRIKDLHGKKDVYYQVNSTYFSALGENEKALLLARAIQIFMPGRPQVWYLDLLAGKNDYAAADKAGEGGHKEINRTNLTYENVLEALNKEVVIKQLELLRFRNKFQAFGHNAKVSVINSNEHELKLRWENRDFAAELEADLKNLSYMIKGEEKGKTVLSL